MDSNFNKLLVKVSFFQSSIAIDYELPELTEYVDAKIAFESLCRKLNYLPYLSYSLQKSQELKPIKLYH